MNQKKVSLKDVAEVLGVSKTLVSLVLNNKGDQQGISPETQRRVREMVVQMNYHPNLVARGLRTGKSNILGMVVADISNVFYSKIVRAVEDKAALHGYHLMVCSSDEDPEREAELIRLLKDRQQVNGIIVATTQQKPEIFSRFKKEQFPFVLIDRYLPRFECTQVLVDNVEGALSMTEHLITTGYSRIALLTISPSHLSSIRDRVTGYKEALKKHGIRFDPRLVREIPFDDIRNSMKKELKDLLSRSVKADAVFLLNNNLALSCLETIRELDLKIPQDIALASFDDVEAFQLCYPPVTAVAQPLSEIGEKAVGLLIEQIMRPETVQPRSEVLKTSLVIRKSCGSHLK
ncbi:MAG: LacI family DNA-binding transcriptional regulator [Bacteroidia bacterium]|nr:LacI family DNA-binding transcriptional regulator [Bacteroidia bacterium]